MPQLSEHTDAEDAAELLDLRYREHRARADLQALFEDGGNPFSADESTADLLRAIRMNRAMGDL